MMHRRQLLSGAAASAAGVAVSARPGGAVADQASAEQGDPTALSTEAAKAWLFCLPVIEMAAARSRMCDPAAVGQRAGINRFAHAPALVGPDNRMITTPNNDTLYSSAFIDLTHGPVHLQTPSAGARYQSVAVLDMYTGNDVVLGARTPGGAAGRWRLLPPGAGATGPRDIVLETPHAWVLGRTLVNGAADLTAARQVQEALTLEGPAGPPPERYARRSDEPQAYFASAARLIATDPPHHKTGLAAFEALRSASRTGGFGAGAFDAQSSAAIAAGVQNVRALVERAGGRVQFDQGWSYPRPNLGVYGEDVLYRAAVAVAGLGALPVEEAMYLRAKGDGDDFRFTGDGAYSLILPSKIPVNGFWSLTMYEITADGQFYLTRNPISRFAIGDRTEGLVRRAGGGLEIFIARKDPGGAQTANWLPAPQTGDYAMTLRCYLPKPELLSGAYRVPPIRPL